MLAEQASLLDVGLELVAFRRILVSVRRGMLTSAGGASTGPCPPVSLRSGSVPTSRIVVAIGCGVVATLGGSAAGLCLLVSFGLGLVAVRRCSLPLPGDAFAFRRSVVSHPDALVKPGGIFMHLNAYFVGDWDTVRAICPPP